MKILLVDTGFSSLPIYYYLREQSDDVWVIGNREEDVIARHAGKRFIKQDYSDINKVRNVIKDMEFDYIVPGCTDISMNTCIQLDNKNIYRDNITVNNMINKKSLFRSVCRKLRLPSPQEFITNDFPLEGKYICKPVDNYSGKGVTIFDGNNKEQLEQAISVAESESPSSQFIIENFINGDLYSCTGFIEKGELKDTFFVREGSSVNPYAVDTSYVVKDISKSVTTQLITALNHLSEHLHLKDGLLHTQFILDEDNNPKIIEITRRCPGDLYSILIENSTGYCYAAKYASFHLGKYYDAKIKYNRSILRHTVCSDKYIIYDGFYPSSSINVQAFFPILRLGNDLEANQKNRVGILFCQSDCDNDMKNLFNKFLQRKIYKLSYIE